MVRGFVRFICYINEMIIGHVSIFPISKAESNISQGGVASYTKYLLEGISKIDNSNQYVIFSNITTFKNIYYENNYKVIKCWSITYWYFLQIYKNILISKVKKIHIQQEIGLYGNYINAITLVLLIILLRISIIKVIITLHGVIDLKKVDKNFIKSNNLKLPKFIIVWSSKLLFSSICFFANKIIVHDNYFKKILSLQYINVNRKKIAVIPHGVKKFEKIEKEKALKYLSLPNDRKILLFLGFLTSYKGMDLLIKGFALMDKNKYYFLIASGKHPKYLNDKNYIEKTYNYYKNLASNLLGSKNHRWDGFVAESDLIYYYSVADLVIFPYTIALSSSGPMALSIGSQTGFVASKVFSHFIKDQKLLFNLNAKSLKKCVENYMKNKYQNQIQISKMANQLSWEKIAKLHIKLYNSL